MIYTVSKTNLREVTDLIINEFESRKLITKKLRTSAMLLIEEICMNIFSQTDVDNINITIQQSRILKKASLLFEYGGTSYNPLDIITNWEDETDESKQIVRRIFSVYKNQLSYKNVSGKNCVEYIINKPANKSMALTFGAMVLGIVVGIILKNILSVDTLMFLDKNVFSLIKTIFLNALKMVIAPVVFFSIASSVSNISGVSKLGKIAGRILGLYAFTTVLAIIVSFIISFFTTANVIPMNINATSVSYAQTSTFDITFSGFFSSIIPTDAVSPIINGNMLQIMVISTFVAVAICMLGSTAKPIQSFMKYGNMLFLQITKIIMHFIPLVTFCSITSMVITVGASSFSIILRIIVALIISMIIMIALYLLLIKILGKMPALPFLRKASVYYLTPFSCPSSTALIPSTIDFCEKKLGIAPWISSFTIPIGSIVNMNGTSIYLITCCLMFFKLSNTSITPTIIITLAVMTFVLSVGAPGITGAGLICLTTLLTSFGIPIEYISITMGVEMLLTMYRVGLNVLGDTAMSTIVAKKENALDEKVYRSKKK